MKTNTKTTAALVQITPSPTKCRTRIEDPDDAPRLRRLECRLYDRCLFYAAKKNWRGFHCNDCQAYERLTPAERRRDHIAIHQMLEETQLLPAIRDGETITDEENDDDSLTEPGAPAAPRASGYAFDPYDCDQPGAPGAK
jgi:hypothetical protein